MRPLNTFIGKLKKPGLNTGDTIVEVMISMVILSFVIIVTYSLSSRTFQSSVNTQYRDQAVNLAQQQIELLKEADNGTPSTISNYKPPAIASTAPFCINPNTKDVQTGNNDMFSGSPAGCNVGNLFTINVMYDNTRQTYHVVTKWDSAGGTTQQTDVYYKTSNSFNGVPVACTPPNPDPYLCASTKTNAPAIGVSVTNTSGIPVSSVNTGSKVIVSWSSTNVNLSTCSAPSGPSLNPGGFAGQNVTSSSGSYTTLALNTAGTYTFEVTCNDASGNPVSPPGQATLTVINLTPSINSFNIADGSKATIYYGSGVTRSLSWTTTNATSCTSSWAGAVATNSSGTNVTAYPGSSFSLTCYNSVGTPTSPSTINITYIPSSAIVYSDTWRMTDGYGDPPIGIGEGTWYSYNSHTLQNDGSVDTNGIISITDNQGYCVTMTGFHNMTEISRTGVWGSYAWDQSFYWDGYKYVVGLDCNGY